MNSEVVRISLSASARGMDPRGLECRLQLPSSWTLTRATDEQVLLMPDELEVFSSDKFAPNIVISAGEIDEGDKGESGPPTILGMRPNSYEPGSMYRSVGIDSSEDRVVFQLVGRTRTESNQVTAVCTALDIQWSSVSEMFDTVIDTLVVSRAEEVGSSDN